MNKPTRILIVEDIAADADLARHALHKAIKGCEIQVVETREDFLNALEVFQPDAILSDYSLPHFDGMQALKLTLKHAPLTPLIVWTGSISEDVAVACMKAGANNYVLKDNFKRLGPAVIHALEERESLVARRQAEENLKEERNLLRTLIDNLPDVIYVMDKEGRKTISNTADWKASGGKTMEDVIGKTDFDLYPPELAEQFGRLNKAVIASGQPIINYEEPGRDANGNLVSILTTKVPLRDREGNVIGLVGVGRDITERKQAEARINDLLAFNEKILNHSPVGILTYKLTGECVYANENAAAIVGTRVETLQAQNFHTLAAWKKSGLYDLVQKAITTQAPVTSDLHHVSTFGKDVWITVHCVTFKSKGEDHVLLSISDITERKRAEEALRESENRLILALSGAQMSVWEWNLQTNQILWSPEIFEITGVKENSFGSTFESFTHLIHRDDIAHVMAAAQKAMTEGTLFAEEFRIIRPDGEVRWLSNLGRAEYDAARAHLRLLGTVQDITRRKQAEIERQALLEIMQGLANTKDLNELLKLIHHSIAKVIHAENFSVVLYQPNSGLFEQIYSVDRYDMPGPSSKLENSLTSYVFRSGEPLLLTQAQFDEMVAQNKVRLVGTRAASWLGVPLKTSDRIIGVMVVQDYENPERYAERDRDFMTSIATQVALAIERTEAVTALRESEEHYRAIFEGVQDAIFVESTDGKILMANERACEMFGYSRAEFMNKAVADLVPKDYSVLTAEDADARLSIKPREAVNQRANGEIFPIEISGRLQVINGEAVLLVVVRDITERKRAEADLLESVMQFRTLFEASPDAILLLDPADKWRIVDCNTSTCQMNGYDRAELIGQSIDILNTSPDQPFARTEYLQKIHEHGILRYENTHRRKDGAIITVEVSAALIQFGKREIVLGIDRDVTERKQREWEARRQMVELEALYENGLAVGRLLKPAEIGNRVIETFARYLSWHHVTIRLKSGESDDLELVAFNSPTVKEAERAQVEQHFAARINKVGQGLSGQVIQTGLPLRTGDVQAHPHYIATHTGIQSGLYMPLKVGEQVIGVISVESETPDAFTEQDERLLATLANQAAIAFENSRLYQAIQKELAERKRAEEALRASETHYRELADSITDILFETDQDLHYTHWNKASEIFSGIPAEHAIGKPMRELFGTSEEQSRREEIYKSVLKEQQARTFETQIVVKGQKQALEITAYPSTRGVSVVAKDVTGRKRAEIIMQKRFELMEYSAGHTLAELLQRTVDEVCELTDSAAAFFHFVEADQTTLGMQKWSTNALELFKVPPGGRGHLSLDQTREWSEAVHQGRSVIQNDHTSLPQPQDLPADHIPLVREIVIPIFRNERIMAIMGMINKPQEYTQDDLEIAERLADYAWDIIDRKQMQVALELERNQLAQRVEERTADLSRANLNLARALRVKDEFLANMSHELRTPLNAILGLSESLGEQIAGPLNEKQQKYITTISESGHHLLSLINDILDLAKIEAGQITLDINKVDIRSVCQSSLRMVKQLAQKKNQELSLEIDDGLGLMWADERRLKQMLVNLLGNAVKFTPENGQLGLEVHGDEAANKITLTVWDHGIGIREADLARLFQPFVQLDSGLARETTGTGLGLVLVAQMARLHGGSVSAESEPEKGSRFSIVLPWEPALAADTATRLRNTGKFRAIKLDQTKAPVILLVEDMPDVTMMIRDYLELAGYKVVTAPDGVEALTQARLVRPDLILMDIQLPRMDGFEATHKLRSEPDFRYTPIIALTALAMPSDRARCLAAGMDEYISKPVSLKALIKIVEGCLFNHEESQPR
ncbi:MAG TPA: PAS domain S-box protein [Anaerolineales bacterium]|nr:PAS domain S-box protein [Anaerolineales bacterium]